jgi:hypothetical protein
MQLLINNSLIPLNPGTSLPLVWRSPLFATSESKIPGTYIYNTALPGSEVLRQEFGQAHRVQRGGKATAELPFTITDGSLRYTGTVTLTEATRDSYDAAFKIDNGDLAGKLKLKTLKDLDLGEDIEIADIFSAADTEKTDYYYTHILPFEQDMEAPDQILSDISGWMTNNGATFTATETISCKQKVFVSVTFRKGMARLILKKNGVEYHNQLFNNNSNDFFIDYSGDLSLVSGDVITVALIAESEELQDGTHEIDNTLEVCRVEYSSTNIFTTNAALDQDDSDFTVFPIYNSKFLENFPDDAFQLDNLSIKTIYTEHFPVLNYYKNGEFPLFLNGTVEGESFMCANLFTPFVYMRKLLRQIASEAGYNIVNNPFDSTAFKNMVLFNAYAENTYTSNTTTLAPVKPTFNLTDHVPAMLQSDFINYITWLTGYVPMVENNLHTITFIDLKDKHIVSPTNATAAFPGKILNNPLVKIEPEYKGIKFELQKASVDSYLSGAIKDLHDKLIYKGSVTSINLLPASGNMVNDMYLVTNLNEYYVFQYNSETYTLTWIFYSKKFPILYTEGIEPYLTISTELCPVLTTRIEDEILGAPDNRIWTVPRCDQAGILEGFPDSLGAEYGLQVLYYKGMGTDSLGASYPLGSSRYSDYPGTPDTFPDLSASSLFDTRYKNWMQWLAYSAKPATLKVILTAGELARIKAHQIYSAYGYNFMVKEIRINLMVDGLSLAEMEIYTV